MWGDLGGLAMNRAQGHPEIHGVFFLKKKDDFFEL